MHLQSESLIVNRKWKTAILKWWNIFVGFYTMIECSFDSGWNIMKWKKEWVSKESELLLEVDDVLREKNNHYIWSNRSQWDKREVVFWLFLKWQAHESLVSQNKMGTKHAQWHGLNNKQNRDFSVIWLYVNEQETVGSQVHVYFKAGQKWWCFMFLIWKLVIDFNAQWGF